MKITAELIEEFRETPYSGPYRVLVEAWDEASVEVRVTPFRCAELTYSTGGEVVNLIEIRVPLAMQLVRNLLEHDEVDEVSLRIRRIPADKV